MAKKVYGTRTTTAKTRGQVHGALKPAAKIPQPAPPPAPVVTAAQRKQLTLNGGEG